MISHSLVIFFKTPPEKRRGGAKYVIFGCLIFASFTLGACTDIVKTFDLLLAASDGIGYLDESRASLANWKTILSDVSSTLVFIFGEGILVCHPPITM